MTNLAVALQAPAIDSRLDRFIEGDERDPTDTIRLADDRWPVLAYQPSVRTRTISRLNFEGLDSFIRPYAKWHIYDNVLLAGRSVTLAVTNLVAFRHLDAAILAKGLRSLDDLAAPDVFAALWDGLADPWNGPPGERPERTVQRQNVIRPFWRATRAAFGVPAHLPRPLTTTRRSLGAIAADDDRVIPSVVVRQLAERLGRHRDGEEVLSARDSMGLAILLLHVALGRRISEVLLAPRGKGADGPLERFDAADGVSSLGFRFTPNKGGPGDLVYVSSEWEDLVRYCVRLILARSDEARPFALERDRNLLILAWGGNGTRRRTSGPRARKPSQLEPAAALPYVSFYYWLRGREESGGTPGAMARLGITTSGEPDGQVYVFQTHAARHTRQTALMADPGVSRLAAQRDLNTTSRDVQGIYQHGLASENERLRARLHEGALIGAGAEWLTDVTTGFEPGRPRLIEMEPRIAALIAANPAFVEFNRVPAGYCVRPQGPAACPEFLACLEATDEGCAWFATDPSDPTLLAEIDERATVRRATANEAAGLGRVVLAGKLAVLADRAERLRDEALEQASQEALSRLRAGLQRTESSEEPV